MNYREETFRKKFDSAGGELGVRADQVVSLKIRETVGSYGEYRRLLQSLKQEIGLNWREAKGDLQGHGYLVSDRTTKVIVVEHETGLEILYIAGSIASIVSLIPLILRSWEALRGRFLGRHGAPSHVHDVEMRRFDSSGRLYEEHLLDTDVSGAILGGATNTVLASAAHLVEVEMKALANQVGLLTSRVEAIEKKLSGKVEKDRKRTTKGRTPSGTKKPKR